MKTCLCFALLSLLLLGGCDLGGSSSNNDQSSCTRDYWVSTAGNDTSGTGSASAPFRTLERARRAVRADSKRGHCTINVNIAAGTYALAAPLKFDAGDSGSGKHPVIYQAAPGSTAPVIISGGIPVTFTACVPETGVLQKKVNKCIASVPDLPPHTMPRQFYVNNRQAVRARSNYVPPSLRKKVKFNPDEQVNPNYKREKDDGYLQLAPVALSHPELVEAVTITQWKMMRCPVASMVNKKLKMAQPCWRNANTHSVPWNFWLLSWLENAPQFLHECLPNTIVTSPECGYNPNMWYLNPYTKKLTYITSSDLVSKDAVLPVLQSLVELVGTPGNPVTNIAFKGLQFSYATWMGPNPAGWRGPDSPPAPGSADGYVADQSGNLLEGDGYKHNKIGHQKVVYQTPGNITLRYAHHITFDGDTFTHLGAVGLELDTGSQDNRIVNSSFNDISSSAIEVGGFTPEDMRPTEAQETSNNLIANNSISYTGRDYYDSAGIFIGYATGTTITHNTINHVPWSAIAIGWGWGLFDKGSFPGLDYATRGMWGQYDTPTIMSNNKITSNLFENFLEKLWDGGAIYTNGAQGTSFANGLLIELNVAKDKRPAAGSNIYYTDGGSSYVTLRQNVSVDNPVGTVNLGPCGYGSSFVPGCLTTGLLPYGADMGGCLPVGNLKYIQNYFEDTLDFYGPQICGVSKHRNKSIPAYPVDMIFRGNVPITSVAQVPSWILDQAGVQ